MNKKVKYIKPKKFYEVFNDISEVLHFDTFDKKDRDLFYDRIRFIDETSDWMDYKSDNLFDKDNIYHTDVATIAELIGQLVIFGRIIRTNRYDEKNLSKGEVPLFLRQIDDKGNEVDMYDVSSGKAIKQWSSKKSTKEKINESIS